MAKKSKLAKNLLKKIEEIKLTLARLGHEGIEFSKRFEKEFKAGKKVVRAAVDTTILKGKLEMAYYELGKETYALISKGRLASQKLAPAGDKISQLQRQIKSAQKRLSKRKKK